MKTKLSMSVLIVSALLVCQTYAQAKKAPSKDILLYSSSAIVGILTISLGAGLVLYKMNADKKMTKLDDRTVKLNSDLNLLAKRMNAAMTDHNNQVKLLEVKIDHFHGKDDALLNAKTGETLVECLAESASGKDGAVDATVSSEVLAGNVDRESPLEEGAGETAVVHVEALPEGSMDKSGVEIVTEGVERISLSGDLHAALPKIDEQKIIGGGILAESNEAESNDAECVSLSKDLHTTLPKGIGESSTVLGDEKLTESNVERITGALAIEGNKETELPKAQTSTPCKVNSEMKKFVDINGKRIENLENWAGLVVSAVDNDDKIPSFEPYYHHPL